LESRYEEGTWSSSMSKSPSISQDRVLCFIWSSYSPHTVVPLRQSSHGQFDLALIDEHSTHSHTPTNMMTKSSPASPTEMDWSKHFPAFIDTQKQASASLTPTSPPALTKQVEIADIGCGFGGLLVALSPLFPNTLMLGLSHPDPIMLRNH
jgi:hypothetical protein